MLELERLTKQYKNKTALEDFSLTMGNGIYGLLGPNGAGKTTLINMVAGILSPTSGRILWDEKEIGSLGAAYRDILGFLPQQPGYYKDFTARRFLRYMAALKGVCSGRGEKQQREEKIEALLKAVNLAEDADRRIGQFSGGMQRRLGIAQALLNDPKLLILDEPTAGLDPQERIRLRNMISALSFDKVVIWTTHIVSDVESIAQEIVLIHQGHLLMKGAPSALVNGVEGLVWQVTVPQQEVDEWSVRFTVGNIMKQGQDAVLRIVGERPCEQAVPAEPTLEDLYLYHCGERSEAGETAGTV